MRVNDKIRANLDKIPIGIPEPLIVGRGINDVAVVVLTLSPTAQAAARWSDKDLYDLAVKLRTELTKVDNIGTSYIVGTGAGGDPRRARPGETVAVRRHVAAACRQGARRQPRVRRRTGA